MQLPANENSEKRCSNCKNVLPIDNFWKNGKGGHRAQCRDCLGSSNRKRASRAYWRNPEPKRAYQRNFYDVNSTQILEGSRIRYKKDKVFREQKKLNALDNYWFDPEAGRQRLKESRKRNGHVWDATRRKRFFENSDYREKILADNLNWRESNSDKNKQIKQRYYINNKDKFRIYARNRKKKIIKATPSWIDPVKDFLIIEGKCIEIAVSTRMKHHIDHIIPLRGTLTGSARGKQIVCGLHIPENLQVIPEKENLSKGCRFNPGEWDEPIRGVD